MGFNKSKVKSNAERYMTQGKISEAIKEYRLIIKNDPLDINTQNILGDLYSKSDETQAAVTCYKFVAEHYNSQGFAKKAIAIYNKIHRLKPDSMSVSEKLAELYHQRGSLAEARKYYEQVAAYHEEKGNKVEALEIWEKVAELAPNNTEIYLKIADAHWRNEDQASAAEAFIEGGKRLVANGRYEEAAAALARALDVVPDDIGAIKAYVECQISLGYPEEAVKILEDTLEETSSKKEIIFLLADCHLELDDPEKAEEVIVNLVVREPISYPKLFDLIEYYLKKDDVDSAVRILSMVAEQVLVSAKSERLSDFLNEILARNPEQAQALRLLARYYEWNKETSERQNTLEQLLEVSRLNELIEDERFALKQLIHIDPNAGEYSERLKEIHNLHGSEDDSTFQRSHDENSNEVLVVEALSVLAPEEGAHSDNGFALDSGEAGEELEGVDPVIIEESDIPERVESIKFYLEQGYTELAENSLKELVGAFGERPEFADVCEILNISPEDHYSEESLQNEAANAENSSEEVSGEDKSAEEDAELKEETSEEFEEEEITEEDSESDTDAEVESDSDLESEVIVDQDAADLADETDDEREEIESLAGDEKVTDAESDSEEILETSDEVEKLAEDFEEKVSDEAEGEIVSEDEPVYGVIEGSLEETQSASEAIALNSGDDDSNDDVVEEESQEDEEVVTRASQDEVSETTEEEDKEESEVLEALDDSANSDQEDPDEAVELSDRDELEELADSAAEGDVEDDKSEEHVEQLAEEDSEEIDLEESAESARDEELALENAPDEEEASSIAETVPEAEAANDLHEAAESPGLEDIRSVLNADDEEEDVDDVYETHYHHAVAYKEMGLLEDAIREFQNAIKCIAPNDENGKYLQCSTLLGHCFMDKDMPKLSVMWFTRAAEVEGLDSDEKQALKYELANAHEANGDLDKAREHFEEIYAFDVDYRDVSERLENVAQPVA